MQREHYEYANQIYLVVVNEKETRHDDLHGNTHRATRSQ